MTASPSRHRGQRTFSSGKWQLCYVFRIRNSRRTETLPPLRAPCPLMYNAMHRSITDPARLLSISLPQLAFEVRVARILIAAGEIFNCRVLSSSFMSNVVVRTIRNDCAVPFHASYLHLIWTFQQQNSWPTRMTIFENNFAETCYGTSSHYYFPFQYRCSYISSM